MARNYPADIQMQAALQERYRKENDAQLSWFLRGKGIQSGDNLKESKQMEVLRRRLDMVPKLDRDTMNKLGSIQNRSYNKKVKSANDLLYENVQRQLAERENGGDQNGGGGGEKFGLSGMRPPTPKSKTFLFDGFSREGKGRIKYLHNRYLLNPEVKFQYPVLSSMEYGWCVSDYVKASDAKKAPFGRTRLISDTFYTRTGIPLRPEVGQLERAKTLF